MKKEIQEFIIKSRLLPYINTKGEIAHKYSYQDIADLVEEEYGEAYSKSSIRRICKKNEIDKQFNRLTIDSANKVEGALKEADQEGVLVEHLNKLENIFALDLDIVNAIVRVHYSYMQNLLDKMESGEPITPKEIGALSSIGESSSKRVMKLFEFILSNSKEEKDIHAYFPEGMAFNEQNNKEE